MPQITTGPRVLNICAVVLGLLSLTLSSCGSAPEAERQKVDPQTDHWVDHSVTSVVHVRAPSSLQVSPQRGMEQSGAVLHDDSVEIHIAVGSGFVRAVPGRGKDLPKERERITIAGQDAWIDRWRRDPERIPGKPIELESLVDLGGAQLSAHAACRDEKSCATARAVIASIYTRAAVP